MATATMADGVQLHYTEKGSGAPTLVLVHGWQASGAAWKHVEDDLAAKYRVITVDLRGSGGSNAASGPYTVEQYATDLYNLTDSLGLDKFVLVGHSMGGVIAQYFAVQHSEKLSKLILVAAVPSTGLELPDEFKAFFRSTAGNREQTAALFKLFFYQPPSDATFNDLVDAGISTRPETTTESFESWTTQNFADRAANISVPTLILAPANDQPMTPDFLREKIEKVIPGSQLIVIADSLHYPQIEQPAVVIQHITDFVDNR